MLHYFYLLDHAFFWQRVRPAMAQCRRARSLEPCRALCQELLDHATESLRDSLIAQTARSLPYRPATWQGLTGELLLAGAREVPRVPLAPDLLCALLAPNQENSSPRLRPAFAPIQQALYGAGEVDFGVGVYRPDHAGLNDADDVQRLTDYLMRVEPQRWTGAAGVDPEDILDAQTWWPELVDMYQRAGSEGWVIVCEEP